MLTVLTLPVMSAYRWGAGSAGVCVPAFQNDAFQGDAFQMCGGGVIPGGDGGFGCYIPTFRARRRG